MDIMKGALDRAFYEPYCVPVKTSKGFVAFMDILGFSRIQKSPEGFKSSDEYSAGVVFGIMRSALSEKDNLIRFLDFRDIMPREEVNDKDIKLISDRQELIRQNLAITFISDSFICLADIEGKNKTDASLITSAFFQLISYVATDMFKKGLPLRGGISFGSFISDKPLNEQPNAFLGEALLNAHSLEMDGSSATICIDANAESVCKELYQPWHHERGINQWMNLCIAEVAFKSHSKTPLSRPCVNLHQTDLYSDNYERFVRNRFSEHGKDVSRKDVKDKIDYTVRYLKSRTIWSDVYSKTK